MLKIILLIYINSALAINTTHFLLFVLYKSYADTLIEFIKKIPKISGVSTY